RDRETHASSRRRSTEADELRNETAAAGTTKAGVRECGRGALVERDRDGGAPSRDREIRGEIAVQVLDRDGLRVHTRRETHRRGEATGAGAEQDRHGVRGVV